MEVRGVGGCGGDGGGKEFRVAPAMQALKYTTSVDIHKTKTKTL